MSANPRRNTSQQDPKGVIDALSTGISVVILHPWLLFLPVLFDLFYWFGPPLLLSPELIAILVAPLNPQGANAEILATTPDIATEFSVWYDTFQTVLSGINLWQFFVWSSLFWPTALVAQIPDASAIPAMQEAGWTLTDFGEVGFWLVGLMVVGLFVNVFWLHSVAYAVQGPGRITTFDMLFPQTARHGLRLLIMALIVLAILVGGLFPVSFLLGLVMLLLPGVGACLYSIGFIGIMWLLFWLGIHLYFTVAAVVVINRTVLEAPRESIRVVRRFFRSTLAFILLTTVLSWGFQIIWNQLSTSDFGRVVSIIGNAALGTAIAAAMMIFFAQRYLILVEEMEKNQQIVIKSE